IQGVHTIFGTPSFVDSAGGDFHLAAGSPGLDAADSLVAPAADMFGDGRWDDPDVPNTGGGPVGYVDIGAPERQSPDGTSDPGTGGGGDPPGGGGDPPGAGGSGATPPVRPPIPDPAIPPPPPSEHPAPTPASPPTRTSQLELNAGSTRVEYLGRSVTFAASCDRPCRLTVTATVRPNRRGRHGHIRAFRLRSFTRSIQARRIVRVRITIPARSRTMLCSARTGTLSVRLTGRADGARRMRTLHVRLRCSQRADRRAFTSR